MRVLKWLSHSLIFSNVGCVNVLNVKRSNGRAAVYYMLGKA